MKHLHPVDIQNDNATTHMTDKTHRNYLHRYDIRSTRKKLILWFKEQKKRTVYYRKKRK